jgi:choline dehydrogenase
MNGRRIYHARGKVLGGSSSINGMIFQRGNPLDYERWAKEQGMASWDYAHCLPYFKKMETCLAGADEWRGGAGPLKLERGPSENPLIPAFLDACEEAGYPRTADVNGFQQEGFARFDRNVYRGRRLSASQAYLHPVMKRPNLKVVTRALAHRVLFDGTTATGVEYAVRGKVQVAHAKEVVLCGGAFNTPQLLQLSGVGDRAHLEGLGIPVVHHNPAVGEHMQDHLEVYVQHVCKEPVSLQPNLKLWKRPWIGLQWLFRKGPGASNHFESGGFARSNDDVEYPNLMFHFLPIAVRYDGTAPAGGHGYQVHIGPMYSNSEGSVKITSTDPTVKPALRFNYMSTDQDRREWVEAIRSARRILEQPGMARYNGGEISPGPTVQTDEEILDWVRKDGETALHPSCTARMGAEEDGCVVDPLTMKVWGVDGVRVCDASAMRYVTNGNIYAPVMMMAEKAADLILGNTPLAPETAPFYRAK